MGENMIELSGISKSFPGVKALDNVSFDLRPGEVHALIGENGAGKSTLMKVISGIYQRDQGEYKIKGRPVGNLTPKKAQEHGIAIIHQELNMCNHLSVAENMYLGREKSKLGYIFQKELNQKSTHYLKRIGLDIDPYTMIGNLSVAKQQMVEIAKALSTNAEIFIMDEPTSSLTSNEINDLFRIIKDLRAEGKGIIYISHRLEELSEIADRVTVMRDGQYITTNHFANTSIEEIISLMVGREIKEKFPRVEMDRGEKIMEVKNLCSGDLVHNISFDLYEGEIIGFAGLVGAGRTEMVRALFGADKKESGEIIIKEKHANINSPKSAIHAGIVCAPEDRKREGLCVKLSIRENVSLANLDLISNKLGIISRKKEIEYTENAIKRLKVKVNSQTQDANDLSGGNQQKIVVGKWLARNAKVVIFDEPTRGIDVAAKVEIYNLMNELKQNGIGIIFVSSEMPEVLGMSDRIIVMCDGRVTKDMPANEATQDIIMQYATQFEVKKESKKEEVSISAS